MTRDKFITITGAKHYHGMAVFKIGALVSCEKEPENPYDSEAIRAVLPIYDTLGYVANSPYTKAVGTMSAGRVYDTVGDQFFVRILFIAGSTVICKVESGERDDLLNELRQQMIRSGSFLNNRNDNIPAIAELWRR